MKYAGWIVHNTRSILWNTIVRVVSGTAQVALGLFMVWLSRRFIDETIRTGTQQDIVLMIVWLVLIVVGRVLLRQVWYLLTTTAGIRLSNDLRLKMYSCLFRRQLYTGKDMHSGDVSYRLSRDIKEVSDTMTDTVPQILITLIQLAGAFFLLRYFDRWLAWALVVMTPVAIVMAKLIGRKLREMTLEIRQDESRIQMHVQEGVEHNAVLRSLGSEQWMTDRLDVMQRNLEGNVLRRSRFTVIARFMLGFGRR